MLEEIIIDESERYSLKAYSDQIFQLKSLLLNCAIYFAYFKYIKRKAVFDVFSFLYLTGHH